MIQIVRCKKKHTNDRASITLCQNTSARTQKCHFVLCTNVRTVDSLVVIANLSDIAKFNFVTAYISMSLVDGRVSFPDLAFWIRVADTYVDSLVVKVILGGRKSSRI
jgi:hypothetical protein